MAHIPARAAARRPQARADAPAAAKPPSFLNEPQSGDVPYPSTFALPDGKPLLTLRAIAFDGWLLWKDALPMDVELWPLLDQSVVDRITVLAKTLHGLFDDTPASRLLDDSPYNVARWWDPAAQLETPPPLSEGPTTPTVDPTWDGGRVMLRRRGYTADQVLSKIRSTPHLEGLPVTQHWVELRLPQSVPN